MRILIPTTSTPGYTLGITWPVNRRDSEGYLTFWRTVWSQRRTVIVLGEDVTPSEAALSDLWSCEWQWCAQPYPIDGHSGYYGLGCVKFEGLMMDRYPELWEQAAERAKTFGTPKAIPDLDFWSSGLLYERGYERHHHTIPVESLRLESGAVSNGVGGGTA